MTAAAVVLASLPAASQTIVEKLVTLDPTIPNYFETVGQQPVNANLLDYALVIGDINGDDMPDAIVSNALALMRVYLLDTDETPAAILGVEDVLPFGLVQGGSFKGWKTDGSLPTTWTCGTTGEEARFLTIKNGYEAERPLIYDIDLDGLNEIIYLEHIESSQNKGDIGLRIYHWENGSIVADTHPQRALGSMLDSGSSGFFLPSCSATSSQHPVDSLNMRIVNVRGRGMPQDILVWANHPVNAEAFRVYGYDTNGGSPTLTLLASHQTASSAGTAIEGDPGHNSRAADIDFDGQDEIIGKHIVDFAKSPTSCTLTDSVSWGMVFKEIGSETSAWAYGNHPDHVVALDFMRSYMDEAGRVIPSPGFEVLAAPQSEGSSNAPDKSGPWVYRAATGHSTDPTDRPWPIRILNVAKTSDGLAYPFPSTNLGWEQPSSTSEWDEFGDDLASVAGGSGIVSGDPDTQQVLAADLIASEEGPEIFCTTKGDLVGSQCSSQSELSGHYMFGSTEELRALSWGENKTGSPSPHGQDAYAIDFTGDRSQVELHSNAGCHSQYGVSWGISTFVAAEPGSSPRYVPSIVDFITPVASATGNHDGNTRADLDTIDDSTISGGDSREESIRIYLDQTVGNMGVIPAAYNSSFLKIRYDQAAAGRTEPSPTKYLKYRLRTQNQAYSHYLDYSELDGLRFVQDVLPPGVASQAYGFCQDRLMDDQATSTFTGAVLLAEGGAPDYTFSLVEGRLPAGLSMTTVDNNLGDALLIYGIPTEAGRHRLEFEVTDANSASSRKVFWITIDGTDNDKQPFIYKGGMDGAYVEADGNDPEVTFKVWIDSEDNPDLDVKLYEAIDGASDVLIGTLTHASGDKYNGTFDLAGTSTVESRRYYVQATYSSGGTTLRSNTWPHLPVAGGAGLTDLAWVDATPPTQAKAKTPVINWVALKQPGGDEFESYPEFVPGELGDDAPEFDLQVRLKDRKGLPVLKLEVVVGHPEALGEEVSRFFFTEFITTGGLNDSQSIGVDLGDVLPEGQFGWGDYSINVRVTTRESTIPPGGGPPTHTDYVSDWWPQLVFH